MAMFMLTASWWSKASNDISVDTEDDVVLLRCLLTFAEFGIEGMGFASLSYSSAFLSVSLNSCSERLDGRVMGGLCNGERSGSWLLCARGDEDREVLRPGFELERGREEGDNGTHV